jgi:hypothetical protein
MSIGTKSRPTMTSYVIVAIPEENDPVWRYSSEKVPHMTLLFLGENLTNVELYSVSLYLQYVAKVAMYPFGMTVKSRGPLGSDDADVLFFNEDRHGKAMLDSARSYMLEDPIINKAYLSADQYPQWTPHLTMGYPATPAKKDDREYGGINYVSFDRVALWTGDYEGPEFRLERQFSEEVDMVMADKADNFLEHFGKKGMKWGVRNDVGHEGEAAKTKTIVKLDKKYDKSLRGVRGFAKVNNTVAEKLNPKLDVLNAKPEYNVPNLVANKPLHAKYVNEYRDLLQASLNETKAQIGTNASGTQGVHLEIQGEGLQTQWAAYTEVIKHDDMPAGFLITPIFDKNGKITGQKIGPLDAELEQSDKADAFLAHHGVKGQKWGVRHDGRGTASVSSTSGLNSKEETVVKAGVASKPGAFKFKQKKYQKQNADTAVTVVATPGKRLATKGGSNRPAHEDAIKTAASKRIARSSSTDALSTKDLQEVVNRMNLEQQYSKLTTPPPGPVAKLLKEIIGDTGKQLTKEYLKVQTKQYVDGKLADPTPRREAAPSKPRRAA